MTYLQRIRTTLAIHANRKVSGMLDGQYASTMTGRSLDFSDLREYVIGDDVKDLDWKATARHGRPLVRRYVADRKHTITLVLATGRSLAGYATVSDVKRDVALTCAGLVAHLALRHGDYVGAYLADGGTAEAWRPSMREVEVERMLLRAAELSTLASPQADLAELLKYAIGATRRRTIILLVTDDLVPDPQEASLIRRLSVQHEILWVTVRDLAPTDEGALDHELWQLDTGASLATFAATDAALADQIRAAEGERRDQRAAFCARLGIAHEQIDSPDGILAGVARLLERGRHARLG